MSDALVVLIGDEVAGVVERPPSGHLRFSYDPAYQRRKTPTPLSLSMPVRVDTHPPRAITP